jgi:ubiquinone/menaquinone biosynthesis C-methylase UbiE
MLLFNNPISSEKADRLISVLGVPANACALDAGCGLGEFLIRVVELTGANGIGIDSDSACIHSARENAAGRITEESYEFREGDIQLEPLESNSFDLVICIGSTHAFGAGEAAYPNTIQSLSRIVRPGGLILVGEGYWKQPPDPEYLELIGEPVGVYRNHAENISFAEQHGLVPLYATVSNDDEWDDFEWSHKMNIERQATLQPDDPSTIEKLKRSREWRNGYLRWGRSTMGFGFYLFVKPPTAT